ncbi:MULTISPECIES: response regulator transcription factor [unclassified Variovorax]|uniref:LuxR C-terminal-related transcriptional regulator n=1 Tax=unclassified Variovorax TaxID=663243 RepID=UPI00076D2F2C|nr:MULTISPECIES: response regulator transcription factor [unclassified Variovorax]KWT82574.1 two component transcriptional regulator, LuxR family [Variovorax sp. WDL1]PNG55743.1 Transcriptional regulatory protein LiaR [Variovorax sp. B4]PNG57167.1 Transcriptional regulatory protein LiaR [Variovorax sp. B2]VTV10516.1 Transcriptional regulatory protein LiaR [Variovorax sp. WDL1]
MPTVEETRVLVVHEDPLVAAGIAAILHDRPGLAVTLGREAAGEEADVLVADYRRGMDYLAAARCQAAGRRRPTARVMVVTPLDREWEVRCAVHAGVHGYVLQGCPIDELVDGVMALRLGQRYLSPVVARRVADSLSREQLTARETQVLGLLTAGSCNKSIARELGIAVGTVKMHVKGILKKLEATTRTHAVILAAERGLVGPASAEGRPAGAAHGRAQHVGAQYA